VAKYGGESVGGGSSRCYINKLSARRSAEMKAAPRSISWRNGESANMAAIFGNRNDLSMAFGGSY
jgi:hypothetical protein